jgi:hypothetical protein
LAHNEGTSCSTNEQTKDGKTGGTLDKTRAGGRDRGEAKDTREKNTRSDLVAEGTKKESHKDGSTNTDNRRSPDFFLGQTKRIADLTKKRSDGEPDEKGDEEAQPRKVEGSHVGTRKVAKLDLSGSVILIGIDLKGVLLVLLPFGLQSSKCHETEERKNVVVRILSKVLSFNQQKDFLM